MAYSRTPYKQPRTVHTTRTLSQIDATRAKTEGTRLAHRDAKATKSRAVYHNYAASTPVRRAVQGYDRSFRDNFINSARGHIVGGKWLHYDAKRKPFIHSITGRNRKFVNEISPGRFMVRTSWRKSSHGGGFHKVLKPRKHRFKRQTHWRVTGHFIVPK
jgi:hypothetical protein